MMFERDLRVRAKELYVLHPLSLYSVRLCVSDSERPPPQRIQVQQRRNVRLPSFSLHVSNIPNSL